ncbi:hypothetical protein [Photobacterium damselae]|uniref:hypothetical protein n=1 Tax=Photobacterium damselae TaxID=38293 RepID=UPI004068822F
MNSTMIKGLCLVLSVATAALSATLTTKFMFGIGSDMGSPLFMAGLGLLLDLAKCATPLFIFVLWAKRKYLSTIFAVLLSVTLSAVSFSASVAALESGVTASQQNSVSYQRIENQISDYRAQVVELRQLAKQQQSAQQITKSQKTLSQIPTLLSRIDELSVQQSQLSSGDSVVSKYGMMISYIASAALELLSWLFVCVTNALYQSTPRTRTQSCALGRTQLELVAQAPQNPTNAVKSTSHWNAVFPQWDAVNDEDFEKLTSECVEESEIKMVVGCSMTQCQAQQYLDIKNAVLTKAVKPSQRGISGEFKGVGRELMNQVLEELKDVGFLKSYRNGYTYA